MFAMWIDCSMLHHHHQRSYCFHHVTDDRRYQSQQTHNFYSNVKMSSRVLYLKSIQQYRLPFKISKRTIFLCFIQKSFIMCANLQLFGRGQITQCAFVEHINRLATLSLLVQTICVCAQNTRANIRHSII